MTELPQQLVNGLGLGSHYALWAVGYGMVFQVLGLMHFAYGDSILVGLYFFVTLSATSGLPLCVSIPASLIISGLVSAGVERAVYRPLIRREQRMLGLCAALGAAYLLRNFVIWGWGPRSLTVRPLVGGTGFDVAGIHLDVLPLLSLAMSIIVVVLTTAFLKHHRLGQAVVVTEQDQAVAQLVGVDTRRVVTAVYFASGLIGGVGALLYVGRFGVLSPTVGLVVTLKAFAAALVGGVGRLRGAFVGGLLLGVMEALISGYVSVLYTNAVVFGLLGLILIVRPTGLYGRAELLKL